MKQKKSIKKGLVSTVFVIVFLVIIFLSAVSIYFINNSTKQSLEKSMRETSELISNKITSEVNNLDIIAQSIGDYHDASGQNSLLLKKYTESLNKQYGFKQIDILDKSMRSVMSSKQYNSNDIISNISENTSFLTDPIVEGNDIYFDYFYVKNNQTIFIEIPYSMFEDIISSVKVGETGSTYILNKMGVKVAHSDKTLVINHQNNLDDVKTDPKLYKEVSELETDMINGNSGFGFYNWKGDKKFGFYCPIDNTNGWSVNVTAQESEFMSGVKNALIVTISVGIIALILAVWIILRRTNKIIKPIESMVMAIDNIYNGNLDVEIKIENQDEIGMMSEKLNGMVKTYREIIGDISNVLNEIAKENLNVSVNAEYPGEFNKIKISLNQIIKGLNDVMGQFEISSSQVKIGAEQVSAGAQSLSQGVTEQASTIEELSATIDTVANQIKDTASDASDGNLKMIKVGQELNVCNMKMKEMISAMNVISETSSEIEKIIKTIEDIAFQTNILALNAAVEAARAGVAGKGFAVVADEVRNLAAKSAEAAQNTTGLIEKSIVAVGNGEKTVDETANSLFNAVDMAKDVTKIVNKISRSSLEQSAYIQEINTGIEQVAAVVQTNSATAEESAASSEELSAQADMLRAKVQTFKLKSL